VYFRDGKSSRAIDLKEIQANQFAAELLMPTELLLKDLKDGIPMDEDEWRKKVNNLAKQYEVSNEAMTIRVGVLLQGGLN
jgi:Zn-dependent peptidase ImmA (M78 family)